MEIIGDIAHLTSDEENATGLTSPVPVSQLKLDSLIEELMEDQRVLEVDAVTPGADMRAIAAARLTLSMRMTAVDSMLPLYRSWQRKQGNLD